MSEKMYPIPFKSLMNWVITEYAGCGDVFGVHKQYHATGKSLPIFGERIETPFGPAAGPNRDLKGIGYIFSDMGLPPCR